MECNRDSAEEFAISAKKSIAKGNLLKAKQLAENANRLFPKQYYKDLITEIDDLLKNGDQLRQRSTVNSNKPSSSASTSKSNDSKKNIENVKSILNENDFYKILKVSKDCSTKDLKVAYRKLALEYHPDKNKTVGASEAFKKIGNAYGVLSTPDKRKQYDLVGPEYDQNNNRQNQHYQYYESAMSPDDVFSAFFGGNFHFNQNGNVRTRHFTFGGNQFRQPNRNNVEQQGFFLYMRHLIPIIVFIVIPILNWLLQSEKPYNLNKTRYYYDVRYIEPENLRYYVNSKFDTLYNSRIDEIEREVLREHIIILQHECSNEQIIRSRLMMNAKWSGDEKAYNRASNYDMPKCTKLSLIT